MRNTLPLMADLLTSIDRKTLLQVAESYLAVNTLADFEEWIKGPVKEYFPHEMMICAVGQLFGEDIHIQHLIGVDYPATCMERLDRIMDCRERRLIQNWLLQYRAQIVNAEDAPSCLSLKEQEEMALLGLTNIAAFGCLDMGGRSGTYFSFSRIPGMLTGRHACKLELLLPYLHQALTRVCHHACQANGSADPLSQLTKRERQILSLMANGLSNQAIANTISRSRLTVQNHVHSILKKLGVRSRVAAVARNRAASTPLGQSSYCAEGACQVSTADPTKPGDRIVPI